MEKSDSWKEAPLYQKLCLPILLISKLSKINYINRKKHEFIKSLGKITQDMHFYFKEKS